MFNVKQKIKGKAGTGSRKNVEIMVPLRYLRNFWRTLEMPLINCEINLILTLPENMLSNNTKAKIFATTTKLCVPVVTFSTQDSTKLLQQLKSGFKRRITWNKYQSKTSIQAPNPYLDFLIVPRF